ncbi:MAG: hypothetical protein V2J55_12160 [Candidatus Competibacteraceae bacterium]|nr:hypothetical protein [Candidatus Competibacteraceae bacterium]
MTRFASAAEALQVFNAGPTAPDWDQAACYLLSEGTPVDVQEHVEITITEALQAFHGFAFQADAQTETGESVMTVHGLANRMGMNKQQLLGWARWLEMRLGESVLRNPQQLNRLEEVAA